MTKPPPILDTCRELIDKQIPNLFRLYLNPYVAQACVCLEEILKQTWQNSYTTEERLPTYLGNAFEEVLSARVSWPVTKPNVGERRNAVSFSIPLVASSILRVSRLVTIKSH